MRPLLPLAALLLLATSAQAQSPETYSLPASAANVSTLSDIITFYNGEKCTGYSLARTCTQAQVCVAASAPGGSSCSAAQARGAGVRLYALTQPGREEYVLWEIAAPRFLELVNVVKQAQRRDFCEAWEAANQATRDAQCSALGLSAGCSPCQ